MYHPINMRIRESSVLKCIVPPTVPSVFIQEKGLSDKNAKRVDDGVETHTCLSVGIVCSSQARL